MVCSRMLTQYTKAPSWQPVPYFQKCYLKSSLSRASCLPPDTWLAVEQIRFLVPMKGYTLSLVWVSCQPFFYYFYFLFTWSCYIALASLEVTVQTGTQRGDPLASTSRVLGLKGCTVTLGLASTFYALSLCVRACARAHTHTASVPLGHLYPLCPQHLPSPVAGLNSLATLHSQSVLAQGLLARRRLFLYLHLCRSGLLDHFQCDSFTGLHFHLCWPVSSLDCSSLWCVRETGNNIALLSAVWRWIPAMPSPIAKRLWKKEMTRCSSVPYRAVCGLEGRLPSMHVSNSQPIYSDNWNLNHVVEGRHLLIKS